MHRRAPLAVAGVAVLLLLAACGGSSDSGSSGSSGAATSSTGKQCGTHTIKGVSTRTFCGDGKATVKHAGKTLTLTQGECETTATYVAFNAGTIVLGTTADPDALALKKTTQYLGILVGSSPEMGRSTAAAPKDGTYKNGLVSGNDRGVSFTTRLTSTVVTLSKNRTVGTAKGTTLAGAPVTVAFSCG